MLWNKIIQRAAKVVYFRRGGFAALLLPASERHTRLFGKYQFEMDLSLGRLQKIYYLKPDCYEPETQQALRRHVQPGMTVFDIGANTGYFSVLMADLVGSAGRVFCFEPHPPNFELLKRNVKNNSLAQARVFSLALSDHRGTAALSVNPVNDGGHSLGSFAGNPDAAGWDLEKLKETVKTEMLDAFVADQKLTRVDLMKIDVEGAETLALTGAQNLLSRPDAPMLLCEVGDIAQRQVGKTEKDLRDILYAHGYRSYRLDADESEIAPETPIQGLINVLFRKNGSNA